MTLTVRLLTAPATGAIAVLELCGPDESLRQLIAGHVDRPVAWQAGTVAHRWWRDADGTPLDDGLVVVRATDCVELQLHGGAGVVAAVRRSLESAGVVNAPGRDSWRHHIERALADARTARLAKLLLVQADAIPDWLKRASAVTDAATAAPLLDELRAGERVARFIEDPPPNVVLAGRPNAGKSTLFNALLGGDRALVSPHAGTTRDTVEAMIAVRGLPVQLVDTAGLTEDALADDRLERRGQLRSLRALRNASLVLHVLDVTGDNPPRFDDVGVSVIRVGSKGDLAPAHAAPPDADLLVSARDGARLDDLLSRVAHGLQLPDDESIVPVPLGRLRQRLIREAASASDPFRALALLLPEAEW